MGVTLKKLKVDLMQGMSSQLQSGFIHDQIVGKVYNSELLPKASVKYLGVELGSNLEWKKHVMNVSIGSGKTE